MSYYTDFPDHVIELPGPDPRAAIMSFEPCEGCGNEPGRNAQAGTWLCKECEDWHFPPFTPVWIDKKTPDIDCNLLRRVRRSWRPNPGVLIEPDGCGTCGHGRDGHGRRKGFALRLHTWEPPTNAQRKARMRERRTLLGKPLPEHGADKQRPANEGTEPQ